MNGIRLGRTVAVAAALTATLIWGSPVAGAQLVKNTGRTGNSTLSEPGARCMYHPTTLKLTSLRVYKPTVYSDYAPGKKRWVGWRVRVVRLTGHDNSRKVVFKSKWQKDTATNATPADGFKNIEWKAPKNPKDAYIAEVVIAFYKQGSKKKIEGKTIWTPEWYDLSSTQVAWCVAQD